VKKSGGETSGFSRPTSPTQYIRDDRLYFSAPMVVTGCHFIDLT
jgi:hypothetical protein